MIRTLTIFHNFLLLISITTQNTTRLQGRKVEVYKINKNDKSHILYDLF